MPENELHKTVGPQGPAMTRRTALKTLGAVGAAGAAGASTEGPVGDAEAVAPLLVGVGLAGAAGLGLLAGAGAGAYVTKHFGDFGELSGTEETADLHRELRTRLVEAKAANDSVLTTGSNRVEDARNVAWPAAKKEAVKARNNEETEQSAIDAAVAKVDAHYAQVQKNLLNRGTEWANTLQNVFDLHQSDSTLAGSPVIRIQVETMYQQDDTDLRTGTALPEHFSSATYQTNLVNGNSFSHEVVESSDFTNWRDGANGAGNLVLGPTGIRFEAANDNLTKADSQVDPVDSGETVPWLNYGSWGSLWSAIVDDHSQMVSNVNTFVTTLYQNTSPGELDPSNWLDASTLASELATDYDSTGHHAYAAAEAAVAGVPGQMSHAMRITWEEDSITVSGSIWTDWAPVSSGSSSTETSTETSTDSGTDSAGTEAFEVGQMYDPSNTNKLVLVTYEYGGSSWIPGSDVWVPAEDGFNRSTEYNSADTWPNAPEGSIQVGYGELSQPFTIESAVDTETGDEVGTVSTESKNHQTAEVGVTKEQMEKLLAMAEEMRSNDSPGGGAGGFDPSSYSWMGIPGVAVLGGGATLAAGFVAWAANR